jgi:hypothetical protein
VLDEELVYLLLGHALAFCGFCRINYLGAGRSEPKKRPRGKTIANNHIGALQAFEAPQRYQLRVARAGSDEIYNAGIQWMFSAAVAAS